MSRRCHIPDVPIPCPTSPGEQGKPLKLLRIVVGHWVITRFGMVAQFAIAGLGSHSRNCSSGVTRQMSNETIFRGSRSPPETKLHSDGLGSDNGVDHVGHHHQPILPPVLQGFAERHSISEAPLGLKGTFGIPAVSKGLVGQVELDRLLRGTTESSRRQDFLGPPATANDNQLAWPFIPFPEGWHGA